MSETPKATKSAAAKKTAAKKTSAAKKATAAKKTAAVKKAGAGKSYEGFTEDERAAMREHAKELKAAARGGDKADREDDVLAKIAEMGEPDRGLAERIHAIVRANAPSLTSRTWYGMPAYAKEGKVLCFFQPAEKFKSRYATFGFTDVARLDDGTMWPAAYALTELTAADEKKIAALVKKAAA